MAKEKNEHFFFVTIGAKFFFYDPRERPAKFPNVFEFTHQNLDSRGAVKEFREVCKSQKLPFQEDGIEALGTCVVSRPRLFVRGHKTVTIYAWSLRLSADTRLSGDWKLFSKFPYAERFIIKENAA